MSPQANPALGTSNHHEAPNDARNGTPPLTELPHFPVGIAIPDLAPWISGNTGITGFTTRDSGRPGPHVVLVSLMHGNEIAGATVLDHLLRNQFTPARGKVTFGFANLAAFAKFDPQNPIASRFVEEDLNRVWDDAQLFGVRRSAELDRARDIRPIIDNADIVLDLHSMLWPSDSLLLCGPAKNGRKLALAIATPAMVVADAGHAGGKRLIDYGRFTEAASNAACVLVESGQHWEPDAVTQSSKTVRRLLDICGMATPAGGPAAIPVYAEVKVLITAKTNRFVFNRPYRGGEIIREAGTLIAHDGDEEIRTPYADCLMVMPSLRPSRGHTAIRLARIQEV